MVSVAPPLECDQPLTAPPISTFRLGVPPSLRNAVTPPVLGPLSQLSQLMSADPYPSPNPIQNPSRRCGYCARAAGTTASARMPRDATTREIRMKVSVEVARGNGHFRAHGGDQGRTPVPSRSDNQRGDATEPHWTGRC